MSLINCAYSALSDPLQRAQYDQQFGIGSTERRDSRRAPNQGKVYAGGVNARFPTIEGPAPDMGGGTRGDDTVRRLPGFKQEFPLLRCGRRKVGAFGVHGSIVPGVHPSLDDYTFLAFFAPSR